jgi:diguanylate cyclase (GGDEF)-like protein
MLLFDLDHFKQINDRFGHATGDAMLQIFAGAATSTLGADVLFARIDGEEFAACMPVGDMGAYTIAERVRRNFSPIRQRSIVADRQHRHRTRARAGHDGRRIAFDRRSRALSRQGAWAQSR